MYLDPGSGSVILQVALAALLGAGVLVRISWRKIQSLLKLGKPKVEASDDDAESNVESKLS